MRDWQHSKAPVPSLPAPQVAKAVGDGAAGGSTLMSNVSYNIVVQHLAELPHNPELHYSGDAQASRNKFPFCRLGPSESGVVADSPTPWGFYLESRSLA